MEELPGNFLLQIKLKKEKKVERIQERTILGVLISIIRTTTVTHRLVEFLIPSFKLEKDEDSLIRRRTNVN